MIWLALDASTYTGSVACFRDALLLGDATVAMRGRETEALMPAVADVMREAGVAPGSLDRVACGAGPGSFTSLRIAGAIAKGLCVSTGCSLASFSSMALIAAGAWRDRAERVLVAVDALRGEHYAQLYALDEAGMVTVAGELQLLSSVELPQWAEEHGATLVGPDQEGGLQMPMASNAARITNMIRLHTAAELAEWEPVYGRLAEAQVRWEAEQGRPLDGG